ncbi:hypothetical protein C0Z10_05770 [Acidipropionibacterium jensenii]|uniref:GlcNAc-PI de-N-acetylase n=1 Tax=Acidipropionibacterium jensenii TaxID=1749 RepID=A0A3Q9UK38_9ACTN|nr:PIG-L family deacetylase [Acidipropionibacterium jensenii]AZZ39334.1 hypothetical protein C0Z10_05770 [Acidipropionibacterium jensenii]
MRGQMLLALILPFVLAASLVGCTPADTSTEVTEPTTVVVPEVPMRHEKFEFRSAQTTRFARPVVLQKAQNRTWVTIGSAQTRADGSFSFNVTAEGIMSLRALSPKTSHQGKTYPQITTEPVTVRAVDQNVRLTTAVSGSHVSLTAIGSPIRPGREVTLQHRKGGNWVNADAGELDARGRATIRITQPKASTDYRAVMAGWRGAPSVISGGVSVKGSDPRADRCPFNILTIVAHQDDDIIFMNPDLQNDLNAGACATTVFLTAGDSGNGTQYWEDREIGPEMAYATMTAMDPGPEWNRGPATFAGHRVHVSRSPGQGRIVLYSLRLPDGDLDGTGTATTGHRSLSKLLDGRIRTITSLDGSSTYDRDGLIATVSAIVAATNPRTVRIQDGRSDQADHADHTAAARVAVGALSGFWGPILAYRGYGTRTEPANVAGKALILKRDALVSYADYDPALCPDATRCPSGDEARWIQRQYRAPVVKPDGSIAVPASAIDPDATRAVPAVGGTGVPPRDSTPVSPGVSPGRYAARQRGRRPSRAR